MSLSIKFSNFSSSDFFKEPKLYQAGGMAGLFGVTTWYLAQEPSDKLQATNGMERIVIQDKGSVFIARQITFATCVWHSPNNSTWFGIDIRMPGSVLDDLIQPQDPSWKYLYTQEDPNTIDAWKDEGLSVSPVLIRDTGAYNLTITPTRGDNAFTLDVTIQDRKKIPA